MKLDKPTTDLHMHSTASDGGYSPEALMKKCATAGLTHVALTDHDTVAGIAEAKDVAESLGLTFIPGIELSTKVDGKSVHVLGYGIDWNDDGLATTLAKQQTMRRKRLDVMLGKLEKADVPLEASDVLVHVDGGAIGRPHVAKALVAKGYVSSIAEAFERFLGEGKPCYVEKEQEMSMEEAIEWIQQKAGVAIVAHPSYYGLDDRILHWVTQWKLDGVEVYHRDHTEEDVRRYERICEQIERDTGTVLLRTGGSDFHHENYGRVPGSLGETKVENELADKLLVAIANKSKNTAKS